MVGSQQRRRKNGGLKDKRYQRLVNKFEMEGIMAQKGLWKLVREKILRERGALPKEDGHAVREYKAMHEEHFLSSWLSEDGRKKEERTVEMNDESEEGVKRGEEKGRKKRMERRVLKEDVTVLFLWRLLKSSVKGQIWRVVVVFLEGPLGEA